MLAAIDVNYIRDVGIGAVLTFNSWTDENPVAENVVRVRGLPKYMPGLFYKRELPVLLEGLKAIPPVEMVVLDGYVRLDDKGQKGLGEYLYEALEKKVPVIGVAKTLFTGGPGVALLRGASARALYITAAGIPDDMAAKLIQVMHGANRLPTLLKRVETASRKAAGLKAT